MLTLGLELHGSKCGGFMTPPLLLPLDGAARRLETPPAAASALFPAPDGTSEKTGPASKVAPPAANAAGPASAAIAAGALKLIGEPPPPPVSLAAASPAPPSAAFALAASAPELARSASAAPNGSA